VFCSTLRIGPYLFYIEKFTTQFKTAKKMIGHHNRFRENDDLPLRRGPVVKKKLFSRGSGQNYYTQTGPTKPQNSWWCVPAPPLLNVKRWCLYRIATPLSSSKKLQ